MAIRVIKHGELKKFTKTCPECGCEFEYDISDLGVDRSLCLTSYPSQYRRYVICPDCGKRIYHDTAFDDNIYPNINLTTTNDNGKLVIGSPKVNSVDDPCDMCPNKGGPKDAFGNPVAGDSPCQWCPHYKWRPTW